MGLAYLGMSSAQGAPLLTDEDISAGLAAPLVAQKLLGTTGEYAILFLILMAVMSTGSAEVIAVASIIIYDIYQVNNTYLDIASILHSVWKLQDFSVTQILREINFEASRSSKTAIFAILGSEFDNLTNFNLQQVQKIKKIKIQRL